MREVVDPGIEKIGSPSYGAFDLKFTFLPMLAEPNIQNKEIRIVKHRFEFFYADLDWIFRRQR